MLNVEVHYYNGDLKEVSESGVTRYLYQDSQTWHTTHPDGREVTVFSNGQTEVQYSVIYMVQDSSKYSNMNFKFYN